MKSISLNGIELNYRDEGTGDTLVLCHNVTSNIRGFDKNIPVLSRYYRTIAADLRGHGLTTHENDPAKAPDFYTFDNLAADQLALLDHLGIDSFYLFGQAYWGLNTAMHLFSLVPERVRGIALSSAFMISSDEGQTHIDSLSKDGQANFRRMSRLAIEEGMMSVYNDRLTSGQFWGPRVLESPEILKDFADFHRQTSPIAFANFPSFNARKRAEIAQQLAERDMPLMLLIGADEKDVVREQFIREMRNDYPATHVLLLPECGHYPTIENPDDFNRALLNFYAGASRCNTATGTGLGQ